MGTDLGLPPPPARGQGLWEASSALLWPYFLPRQLFLQESSLQLKPFLRNKLFPDKSAAQKEPASLNC